MARRNLPASMRGDEILRLFAKTPYLSGCHAIQLRNHRAANRPSAACKLITCATGAVSLMNRHPAWYQPSPTFAAPDDLRLEQQRPARMIDG